VSSIYGSHLERHKEIFERHTAGETYKDLAKEFNVSPARASQMAQRWQTEMRRQSTPLGTVVLPLELWEYASSIGDGDANKGVWLAIEYHRDREHPNWGKQRDNIQ
jgi:hypothetical protein